MPNSRQKLSTYLKLHREILNLSQAQVADQLGYQSAQFISNWERGVSSPPLDKVAQLVSIFKVPRREVIDLILEDTRTYLEEKIPSTRKHRKAA